MLDARLDQCCVVYRDRNKVEIDPRGKTGDLVTGSIACLL